VHQLIFAPEEDANAPTVDPARTYETYMVPLDMPRDNFPWGHLGSRHSKETRRGEAVQANYSPALAMLRVATFGSDCYPDEHPSAGSRRHDGHWVAIGDGRPFVPSAISEAAALEGLAKAMPDGRYKPQTFPRDRRTPGELDMEAGDHLRLQLGTLKKKRKRKNPLRLDPECVIFLSPPHPPIAAGTAPSCAPPAAALMHHPVVITAREKNLVPPARGMTGTYLIVQSALGGATWRAHVSQALSFTNNFAARWNAQAEQPTVDGLQFKSAMGLSLDRVAARSFQQPDKLLVKYFDASGGPTEECEEEGWAVLMSTKVATEQQRAQVPPYLLGGEWRA
jgi:hypothetical protein